MRFAHGVLTGRDGFWILEPGKKAGVTEYVWGQKFQSPPQLCSWQPWRWTRLMMADTIKKVSIRNGDMLYARCVTRAQQHGLGAGAS